MQSVLQSLGNQNMISDIDTSDSLTLSSGMNPLHLFMFLLLAVWGFLYVSGRSQPEAAKSSGGGSPSGGDGGAGGDGGLGGAPPDAGDLY